MVQQLQFNGPNTRTALAVLHFFLLCSNVYVRVQLPRAAAAGTSHDVTQQNQRSKVSDKQIDDPFQTTLAGVTQFLVFG